MLYKKIRNLIAILAVMIALLPAFLYSTQHIYYGPKFSFFTTIAALICFITSALIQLVHNKKKVSLFPVRLSSPVDSPSFFSISYTSSYFNVIWIS